MKIGVIGFGKTGKAVSSTILRNSNLRLEWVVRRSELLDHRSIPEFLGEDSDEPGLILSSRKIKAGPLLDNMPVDMIIDFSSPTGIEYYGEEAAERGITIVSAVSNYNETTVQHLKKLSEKTTVFWSPNITVGVNYLMIAAKFLKKIAPDIDMVIIEEHFRDKPEISGTAKVIADNIGIPHSEIKSIRAGGIIGKHEVICGFPFQTVRLIHESITREAFGSGVIFVAENLEGKPAGFYTFEDLFMPYFKFENSFN